MPNFVVVEFYLLLLRLFGDGEGKGGIVFSMAAMLKIRATTSASASSST
jgi:hypothetical protein